MRQTLVRTAAAIGLVVLCTMILSGQNTVSEAASEPTKWEHLALTQDVQKDEAKAEVARQINQLGGDGWQLVDVEGIHEDGTTTKTIYYFKREG